MFKKSIKSLLKSQNGVAAIEVAFVMPFMILLYFGLVDLTSLVTFNRKITSVASTMADLVAQQKTTVLKSTIIDEYNAAYTIMLPTPQANVRVEVFGYRKNPAGVINSIWSTNNGKGAACTGTPSTANMASLMAAGNDLVVARSCYVFHPYIAAFLGNNVLGATSFNLVHTISVRPRSSLLLNCVDAAGAVCT
jgi:Flp pilus assembly protein TadG